MPPLGCYMLKQYWRGRYLFVGSVIVVLTWLYHFAVAENRHLHDPGRGDTSNPQRRIHFIPVWSCAAVIYGTLVFVSFISVLWSSGRVSEWLMRAELAVFTELNGFVQRLVVNISEIYSDMSSCVCVRFYLLIVMSSWLSGINDVRVPVTDIICARNPIFLLKYPLCEVISRRHVTASFDYFRSGACCKSKTGQDRSRQLRLWLVERRDRSWIWNAALFCYLRHIFRNVFSDRNARHIFVDKLCLSFCCVMWRGDSMQSLLDHCHFLAQLSELFI